MGRPAGGGGAGAGPLTRVALALAASAAVWAVVGSLWILPELSANSDEGIYLLQADGLRHGELRLPAPETDAAAFRPWFSAVRDGHYVLKYTPVHAAGLSASILLTGTARTALALIAAVTTISVVWLARELGVSRRGAAAAGAIFVVSPLNLQLSITFLPYGTSLALALISVALSLRSLRTGSVAAAAAAGVALGVAFFARPYDAVLVAAAIVVVGLVRRSEVGVRQLAAVTAGAVPGVVLLLAFNQQVTGDPFQLPFNLLDPSDRPWFGLRRSLPSDPLLDFGPAEALRSLRRNLLLVVATTGGGLVAVVVAAGAVGRRPLRWVPVLALMIVWCIGYALFWGSYLTAFVWDGALFLGPYYFAPVAALIAIPAGSGLVELARSHRAAAAVAGAAMVVLSMVATVPSLAEQLDRTEARRDVHDAIRDGVEGPALVLLPPVYGPYLQNPFSFLRNAVPLGSGDVVYALARTPADDRRLIDTFPERTPYRLVLGNGWTDSPTFAPDVDVLEITP